MQAQPKVKCNQPDNLPSNCRSLEEQAELEGEHAADLLEDPDARQFLAKYLWDHNQDCAMCMGQYWTRNARKGGAAIMAAGQSEERKEKDRLVRDLGDVSTLDGNNHNNIY